MKKASAILLLCVLAVAAHAQDDPAREFVDGSKLKYSSAGDPKAKGLTLTIEYPRSWSAEPGDRPNIPQKFVSEDGKGLEMAVILVKELPRDVPISRTEIEELFQPSLLKLDNQVFSV